MAIYSALASEYGPEATRRSQRPRDPCWNSRLLGTRVPLKNLYDYLEAGDSLDEFLDDFPSVTREQAVAALDDVKLCAQNGRIRPGTAGRSTANFLRNPPQTDTTR
jgi:uncharacterized protein (DUF433 family)